VFRTWQANELILSCFSCSEPPVEKGKPSSAAPGYRRFRRRLQGSRREAGAETVSHAEGNHTRISFPKQCKPRECEPRFLTPCSFELHLHLCHCRRLVRLQLAPLRQSRLCADLLTKSSSVRACGGGTCIVFTLTERRTNKFT
jgi:hypothetical protein